MSEPRNCRKCGKVFTYFSGHPICPSCVEADERDFKRVKEYLYNNPRASMAQVSEDLEVSVEKITRYLREGRLEIVSNDGNMVLECESCGKAIRSGRFCNDCSKGLSNELKSTANQISESATKAADSQKRQVEMRFLNKNEKK